MDGFILTIVLTLTNGGHVPLFSQEPFPTQEVCQQKADSIINDLVAKDTKQEIASAKYVCVTTEQFRQFQEAIQKGKQKNNEGNSI